MRLTGREAAAWFAAHLAWGLVIPAFVTAPLVRYLADAAPSREDAAFDVVLASAAIAVVSWCVMLAVFVALRGGASPGPGEIARSAKGSRWGAGAVAMGVLACAALLLGPLRAMVFVLLAVAYGARALTVSRAAGNPTGRALAWMGLALAACAFAAAVFLLLHPVDDGLGALDRA